MRLTRESQVWATLADEYERGYSRELPLSGLCVSLGCLDVDESLKVACRARLWARFRPKQPRWWQFWKPFVSAVYYWPVGETKVRAEACDALFHEAINEEAEQAAGPGSFANTREVATA